MGFQPWQAQLAFLLLLLLHLRLLPSSSAQNSYDYVCSDNHINYTSNSVYDANLNSILSNLSNNIDDNGFYNASSGRSPDRANVIALCRGDLQLVGCRSCIRDATEELVRQCPNQKQGVIFYEFCLLRFSNASIFGTSVSSPTICMYNVQNRTLAPSQFFRDLGMLIVELRAGAAGGSFWRKVAFGKRGTTYAVVQCSPDLRGDDCVSCLTKIDPSQSSFPCSIAFGCRAFSPSCNTRFETYPFYNETRLQELAETAAPETLTPPLPQPPPTAQERETMPSPPPIGKRSRTIIIIVAIVICLAIAAGVFVMLIRRSKKKQVEANIANDIKPLDCIQFDFGEIKAATDDFSHANKLGKGGFGAVYKGKLELGQEIAVKRLSDDSGQGHIEFKNEVLLVAKLQHRNLVKLLGFSIERKERLLVYELVKNASHDKFLFDPIKRSELDWERRNRIICGSARGLYYLHEESRLRIIHRDLKASNILLDHDMNPKIADFGMARLCVADELQGNTDRIVGTYGYMSPEYAMYGQFSVKSDVFSFGVLVLEIVSGQKNHSFRIGENVEGLLSTTWKLWSQGRAEEIIDPMLRDNTGDYGDMVRCIHIGLLCVQENPCDRPNMAHVVLMVSSDTISLSVPKKPAFFMTVGDGSNNALIRACDSKELESSQSNEPSKNMLTLSDLCPR